MNCISSKRTVLLKSNSIRAGIRVVDHTVLGSPSSIPPSSPNQPVVNPTTLAHWEIDGASSSAGVFSSFVYGGASTLVERFDIESYSDFSAKLSNCIGLVLFCIDAKFCNKIFVGISYLFEKNIEKRDIRWKALDEIY